MLDDFCEYMNQNEEMSGILLKKIGTACYNNQMKKQKDIKSQQKSDDGSFIRKLGSAFHKKNMKEQESDEER